MHIIVGVILFLGLLYLAFWIIVGLISTPFLISKVVEKRAKEAKEKQKAENEKFRREAAEIAAKPLLELEKRVTELGWDLIKNEPLGINTYEMNTKQIEAIAQSAIVGKMKAFEEFFTSRNHKIYLEKLNSYDKNIILLIDDSVHNDGSEIEESDILLTPSDAARFLDCGLSEVLQLLNEGNLKFEMLDGVRMISRKNLSSYKKETGKIEFPPFNGIVVSYDPHSTRSMRIASAKESFDLLLPISTLVKEGLDGLAIGQHIRVERINKTIKLKKLSPFINSYEPIFGVWQVTTEKSKLEDCANVTLSCKGIGNNYTEFRIFNLENQLTINLFGPGGDGWLTDVSLRIDNKAAKTLSAWTFANGIGFSDETTRSLIADMRGGEKLVIRTDIGVLVETEYELRGINNALAAFDETLGGESWHKHLPLKTD